MFEITGDDIARLGDSDLRTLVVRLALAELQAQGLPRSAVLERRAFNRTHIRHP